MVCEDDGGCEGDGGVREGEGMACAGDGMVFEVDMKMMMCESDGIV